MLVLSQSSSETFGFTALAAFLILLLPYFFCGIANVQQLIIKQNNPRAWRIGLFLMFIFGGWPVLLVITILGIYHHISNALGAQAT